MLLLCALVVLLRGIAASAVAHATPSCTAKASSPKGALCGVKGSITDPKAFTESLTASSVKDCAIVGYRHSAADFVYAASDNSCTLDVGGSGFQRNSSGSQKIYDLSCFKCENGCVQPYGKNLIDDGGFEKATIGPWYAVYDNYTSGKGRNSASSFQVVGFNRLSQNINKCQNYIYKFSFDAKIAPNDSLNPLFQLSVGPQIFVYTILNYTAVAGRWVSGAGFFLSSNFNSLTFNFGLFSNPNPTDRYNLDNVVLEHFPSNSKTEASASASFVDGGFESGTLDNWRFTHSHGYNPKAVIISPGLDNSNYAFQIQGYYPKMTAYLNPRTPLRTVPNTSYMMSFDYSIEGNVTRAKPMDIHFLLAGDYYDASYGVIGTNNIRLDWGTGTFSFPIAAQTNTTDVTFYFGYRKVVTNFTLDNFKLERIVEKA